MRLPGVRGSLSSVTRSTCLPPRCSWFWRETLVANAVPRVVAPCDRRTGPRQSGGPLLDGVVWWPRQTGSATLPVGRLQIGPRRRRATGRAGVRAGLAGARTPLPHLVGSSRPGKSESLLQDQRRGRRPVSRMFATRCSVSREQQGGRISSALSPAHAGEHAGDRPTARQCDAARPFCRWMPCRMAGFVWPARRQIPCKEQLGFMASRRGLGGLATQASPCWRSCRLPSAGRSSSTGRSGASSSAR